MRGSEGHSHETERLELQVVEAQAAAEDERVHAKRPRRWPSGSGPRRSMKAGRPQP